MSENYDSLKAQKDKIVERHEVNVDRLRGIISERDAHIILLDAALLSCKKFHSAETKNRRELEDEVKRLREALEFYAARENWEMHASGGFNVMDYGLMARAALEKS